MLAKRQLGKQPTIHTRDSLRAGYYALGLRLLLPRLCDAVPPVADGLEVGVGLTRVRPSAVELPLLPVGDALLLGVPDLLDGPRPHLLRQHLLLLERLGGLTR